MQKTLTNNASAIIVMVPCRHNNLACQALFVCLVLSSILFWSFVLINNLLMVRHKYIKDCGKSTAQGSGTCCAAQ